MPDVRTMWTTMSHFHPIHASWVGDALSLLASIIELAQAYPYSHNVFGKKRAAGFVRAIAVPGPEPEGWHVAKQGDQVLAAIHLKAYGPNHPIGHALWKLSHPLAAQGHSLETMMCLMAAVLRRLASHNGTHKVVLHLGESERLCIEAAQAVGLVHEGTISNYYRFGEACLIFGITIVSPTR